MGKFLLIKNGHITNQAKRCLTVVLCFLFIGCSQNRQITDSDKLDLDLKLTQGQTYVMRLLIDNKDTYGAQSPQQMVIKQSRMTELGININTVDAAGIMSLKVTFLAMKETVTNPGGFWEYDYTAPPSAQDTPLARIYHVMIGESFTVKIRPNGEVAEVAAEDMYGRMAEKIVDAENKTGKRQMAGTARIEEIKQDLKKIPFTSAEALKETIRHIIPPYPGKTIRTGDSWTGKFEADLLSPLEMEGTYVLKERRQGQTVIEADSNKNLTDETILDSGGLATYTGNVTIEGNLKINEASGWLIHKQVKTLLVCEIKENNRTRPVSIERTVSVELLE